jgi:signal transduction histidine kinase
VKSGEPQFSGYNRMEITKPPMLSEDRVKEVDMHSFINLITVVDMQLHMLKMEYEAGSRLDEVIRMTEEMAGAIRRLDTSRLSDEWVEAYIRKVLQDVEAVENGGQGPSGKDHWQYLQNLQSIMSVFRVRFNELKEKLKQPQAWHTFDIEDFRNDFRHFFYAMEKNSRGRYRIIKNIAEQEEEDYLVNLEIDSDCGDGRCLNMPLVLKDVLRDLIANARKYTLPGGRIQVGLSQKGNALRIVVEDSGLGIPKSEINKVVEYGYRAENVRERVRTMGGGFGLTKAWQVTYQLGGRMWISSEEGKGTKISLRIPSPSAEPPFASVHANASAGTSS